MKPIKLIQKQLKEYNIDSEYKKGKQYIKITIPNSKFVVVTYQEKDKTFKMDIPPEVSFDFPPVFQCWNDVVVGIRELYAETELEKIKIALTAVLHEDAIEDWMSRESVQFGGRTPNDLILNGEGRKVRNLINAANFGLY